MGHASQPLSDVHVWNMANAANLLEGGKIRSGGVSTSLVWNSSTDPDTGGKGPLDHAKPALAPALMLYPVNIQSIQSILPFLVHQSNTCTSVSILLHVLNAILSHCLLFHFPLLLFPSLAKRRRKLPRALSHDMPPAASLKPLVSHTGP